MGGLSLACKLFADNDHFLSICIGGDVDVGLAPNRYEAPHSSSNGQGRLEKWTGSEIAFMKVALRKEKEMNDFMDTGSHISSS